MDPRRLETQLSERDLIRLLALTGSEDVIDLGSGVGFYTDLIAALTTGTVYALDLQPEMHDFYRARGMPPNVRLVLGDMTHLDLTPAGADVACSISVWHETGGEMDLPGLARALRTRARHTINRERFEYIARQASGGGFEQFCLAGEREYILTEQGDVYGCELIGDKLGNVREAGFDFRRIRESEAAAEFVRAKHERRCRCTHECNARTMILFNRKNAATLVAGMLGARGAGDRD